MLDCYTLYLLSLPLTLSIVIIIIVISTINAILEEKEKQRGGRVVLLMKQCGHVYACYLYNNFFVCLFVCLFVCFLVIFLKKNFFLEFIIVFVNLLKIKKKKKKDTKVLMLRVKKSMGFIVFVVLFGQTICYLFMQITKKILLYLIFGFAIFFI